VIACNNSGVWNEQGDSLEFSIAPAYYQTNWFSVLCAAALLMLVWAAYQFRVRQVRQELTIVLEAKIDERTRIARDLHDTLLQSFHGLLYRFQAVRNLLPGRPDEAVQALDSALIRAEQALHEGRQSIQELRSGLSAEDDLDQMLIAIGQEIASSLNGRDGAPSFNVIEEGVRRDLSPIVTEEILRVARELLQNAFRHARAGAIEAEIRYDKDVFRMIVRDDGIGIDPQVLKDGGRAGHWGMPGVHERARAIGAKLEFWSEAGAGTEVRLTLPEALAYQKSRNGGWHRLFRKRRMHEHKS
jgi:signal transduction histidine kinase